MLTGKFKKYAARHREDITGEHKIGDAGQLVLFIAFMVVWITDAFFLKYSTLLNDYIPFLSVRLWLGIIILLVSGLVAWTGMVLIFGTARDIQHVVRQGVFARVRHPIYLSEILLYLGLLLLNISLAALGVWMIGIAFLHYISRYEEKVLLNKFGDEYRRVHARRAHVLSAAFQETRQILKIKHSWYVFHVR